MSLWSGWLVCAECSSLGLDKSVGNGNPPTQGVCSSCGQPWPRKPWCNWKGPPRCMRDATRIIDGRYYACDEHAKGSGVPIEKVAR